jgi:cell division protein FtsB
LTFAAQAQEARPRPFRSLLSALLVFLVLLLATAALKGWRDLESAKAREASLRERVDTTQKSIEELRHRIQDLRSDPATLDRIAREELGLVGPHDVVLVLPPPQAPAPASAAPAAPRR